MALRLEMEDVAAAVAVVLAMLALVRPRNRLALALAPLRTRRSMTRMVSRSAVVIRLAPASSVILAPILTALLIPRLSPRSLLRRLVAVMEVVAVVVVLVAMVVKPPSLRSAIPSKRMATATMVMSAASDMVKRIPVISPSVLVLPLALAMSSQRRAAASTVISAASLTTLPTRLTSKGLRQSALQFRLDLLSAVLVWTVWLS
jgi:hypothetical protein